MSDERPPYPVELAEIGDVTGKTLLHLQCHFGMDTLGWARLGARVTGVDFSRAAIEAAQRLSADTGCRDASSKRTCTMPRLSSMNSSTSCT